MAAAREMVDAAERGLDAASGRSPAPSGALRLTAPAFLAETGLPRHLAAYSGRHPNVRLAVSFTDAPRDLLRDGLDLAIRIGKLDDSTHRARKLAAMRRVLVAAPRYVVTRRPPGAPGDLATWDYVQLSSRPAAIALASSGRSRPVSIAFTPKLSVDHAAALRELVIAGAGLAPLPEVMVRADLAHGRLVEVLPGWQLPILGVHAIWPATAQRATLTLGFLDFMASRIATLFEPSE